MAGNGYFYGYFSGFWYYLDLIDQLIGKEVSMDYYFIFGIMNAAEAVLLLVILLILFREDKSK